MRVTIDGLDAHNLLEVERVMRCLAQAERANLAAGKEAGRLWQWYDYPMSVCVWRADKSWQVQVDH